MNKKILTLSLTLLSASIIPGKVNAAQPINLFINGNPAHSTPYQGTPYIADNNRTYVPLRFISESLGHQVNWEQSTQSVNIDNKIIATVGSKDVNVNGKMTQMDGEVTLVENRTYVPLRFVSENLGYNVDYKQESQQHMIYIENTTPNNNTGNNGNQKPVDKPVDKPVENPTDKPINKPTGIDPNTPSQFLELPSMKGNRNINQMNAVITLVDGGIPAGLPNMYIYSETDKYSPTNNLFLVGLDSMANTYNIKRHTVLTENNDETLKKMNESPLTGLNRWINVSPGNNTKTQIFTIDAAISVGAKDKEGNLIYPDPYAYQKINIQNIEYEMNLEFYEKGTNKLVQKATYSIKAPSFAADKNQY